MTVYFILSRLSPACAVSHLRHSERASTCSPIRWNFSASSLWLAADLAKTSRVDPYSGRAASSAARTACARSAVAAKIKSREVSCKRGSGMAATVAPVQGTPASARAWSWMGASLQALSVTHHCRAFIEPATAGADVCVTAERGTHCPQWTASALGIML